MTTPIATGRRSKLVTFSRRSITSRTTSRDIAGWTWASLGTRWAQIKRVGGNEQEFAGQMGATQSLVAIFPYLSGLTTEDKVTFDSTDYGIESLEDRDAAGIEHIATLKEWSDG